MTIDVVNTENKKVGSLDLNETVFGGRAKADLIHESVVRANAAERRGTHATKNRALVSGSGKKPWRQKGTGRARVGETRNPLWRKGGTVFGPQPRSYEYQLPKKVEKGALRAALVEKLQQGSLIVVDTLTASEVKTKAAVGVLKTLGVTGKAVLIDAQLDEKFALSVRNVAGVTLLQSNRVTARDVANTKQVVLTRAAVEKLEAALTPSASALAARAEAGGEGGTAAAPKRARKRGEA
ncbi:MAG TPA: 50S ribosomal protein L4 [Vicinamibacterales bacterium]|nr:50S ribosomal protein L4 [Vicinamibacterales bacterium]